MVLRRSPSVLHRPLAVIAVAAAVVIAIAVRAPSSSSRPGPVVAPVAVAHAEPDQGAAENLAVAPIAHELAPEDHDLLAWVEWKYRYLLDDARLDPASRRRLRQLLVERERLVRDPDTSSERGRLDDIERQLGVLLAPADRAQYEALRESDAEQRRLTDYG